MPVPLTSGPGALHARCLTLFLLRFIQRFLKFMIDDVYVHLQWEKLQLPFNYPAETLHKLKPMYSANNTAPSQRTILLLSVIHKGNKNNERNSIINRS